MLSELRELRQRYRTHNCVIVKCYSACLLTWSSRHLSRPLIAWMNIFYFFKNCVICCHCFLRNNWKKADTNCVNWCTYTFDIIILLWLSAPYHPNCLSFRTKSRIVDLYHIFVSYRTVYELSRCHCPLPAAAQSHRFGCPKRWLGLCGKSGRLFPITLKQEYRPFAPSSRRTVHPYTVGATDRCKHR